MNRKSTLEEKGLYVTGIPGIDAQHRDLFLLMEGLLAEFEEKRSADYYYQPVEEMLLRFRSHCATEESLLDMIGFPNIAQHKILHGEIISGIIKVLKDFNRMEISGISRSIHQISDAMHVHLESSDSEYVDFIENLMALRKKYSITALKARGIAGQSLKKPD